MPEEYQPLAILIILLLLIVGFINRVYTENKNPNNVYSDEYESTYKEDHSTSSGAYLDVLYTRSRIKIERSRWDRKSVTEEEQVAFEATTTRNTVTILGRMYTVIAVHTSSDGSGSVEFEEFVPVNLPPK